MAGKLRDAKASLPRPRHVAAVYWPGDCLHIEKMHVVLRPDSRSLTVGPVCSHVQLALMSDYLREPKFSKYDQVPDPYYGGSKGFELVLDLLDDACTGLLEQIQQRQKQEA
jgi:protein-tyrosine-phosphatase